MDEEKLNNIIDKKLLEAKLDMHEKRMNYFIIIAGILISVFGVILPLIQSSSSSDKLDKAIQEMKNDFNKNYEIASKQNDKATEQSIHQMKELKSDFLTLANEQQDNLSENNNKLNNRIKEYEEKFAQLTNESLRKPILKTFFEGKDLSFITLEFSNENNAKTIVLKNVGDAPARNIKIFLYLKTEKDQYLSSVYMYNKFCDENAFNNAWELNQGEITSLAPDQTYTFNIEFGYDRNTKSIAPALLKIYYDQPEPMKCNFTCNLDLKIID